MKLNVQQKPKNEMVSKTAACPISYIGTYSIGATVCYY